MSYVHPTIERLREDKVNIAEIEGGPKPIFKLKKSQFALTREPPEIVVTNEDPSIELADNHNAKKVLATSVQNPEVAFNTEMSMISKKPTDYFQDRQAPLKKNNNKMDEAFDEEILPHNKC